MSIIPGILSGTNLKPRGWVPELDPWGDPAICVVPYFCLNYQTLIEVNNNHWEQNVNELNTNVLAQVVVLFLIPGNEMK